MDAFLSEAESPIETVKALLEIGGIGPFNQIEGKEKTPDFRFFISYHEEERVLNACALATCARMYPMSPEKWTGDAHSVYRESTPVHQYCKGYVPTALKDNSEVGWGGANPELLGPEIGEKLARFIHPALFETLREKEDWPAQNGEYLQNGDHVQNGKRSRSEGKKSQA